MMENEPHVSIIILNWNGLGDTIECLESLKNVIYSNYQITVVDNGSQGNEADVLEAQFIDYITVIRNKENLGYAEGNNVALRQILNENRSKYILLLNNDTTTDRDFLKELVYFMEANENVAAVGPMVYDYQLSHKDGEKIISSTSRRGRYKFLFLTKVLNKHVEDKGYYNQPEQVSCLSGCCILTRTIVFREIGTFDPQYFTYYEDTDLCIRMRKRDYALYLIPSAKIWHKISKSTGGDFNELVAYYSIRNMILLLRKNAPFPGWFRSISYLTCFFSYHFISALFKREPRIIASMIKGLLWHLHNPSLIT